MIIALEQIGAILSPSSEDPRLMDGC